MYCPDEECGPDEQECIVIYNGSDHYNSTAINATLQGDRNESEVEYDSGAEMEAREAASSSGWVTHVEIEPLAPELLEAAGIDPLTEATQSSATAMDPQDSPAKQARVELSIQQLAEQYLRQRPTVPEVQDFELDEDSGERWPAKHCAFRGCKWTGLTDDGLTAHLSCQHSAMFREVNCVGEGDEYLHLYSTCEENEHPHQKLYAALNDCPDCMCSGASCTDVTSTQFTRNWRAFYDAAVAYQERKKMPTVGCSVDRRSSEAFSDRYNDESLSAPMCFLCARVLALDTHDDTCGIAYRQMFTGQKFGKMDRDCTHQTIGHATYMEEYGKIPARASEQGSSASSNKSIPKEAFKDWLVCMPFDSGDVTVLCCPEDVQCDNHHTKESICRGCMVPMCDACYDAVCPPTGPAHRPGLALSNDLWFGYIPQMIYEEQVTYMELLCASICHPTMMSFQVSCYGWNMRKEKAHMQKHRVGARGNMTAFQVPWENIFEEMQGLKEQSNILLPRVGAELLQLVQVVLQLNDKKGDKPDATERKALLHGATVRRDVVIKLIQTMVDLGHRDYAGIDMADVVERAKMLHTGTSVNQVDGEEPDIPDGVYTVIECNASADVDVGKVSVPGDALTNISDDCGGIEDAFKSKRVVGADVKSSNKCNLDLNMQMSTAIASASEKLADVGSEDATDAKSQALMQLTLGPARNQFESTFFLTAYAFLFPYSVGAPDLKFQSRDRRKAGAARVDFSDDWCPALMTRAEGQFRRDLTLPFALWNLTFRTVINVGHNMYSIKRAAAAGSRYTAKDFAEAAENISAALAGTWETRNNVKLRVNGDIRKLRNAPGLSPPLSALSKQMLESFHATCKRIEGTQETRQMMRHELTAYRVFLGRPIMVTISPNERHNMLMIRLSRTRESDPMANEERRTSEEGEPFWGSINEPKLVESELLGEVSVDSLLGAIPKSGKRRQILARDPLASVYGFRMLCKIVMATLFGVRICSKCPDCNFKEGGCVDAFGSVALSEGGSFGRSDGYYGSIENQKEDSQHLHCMWWLQCIHQSMPLVEIAAKIKENCELFEAGETKLDILEGCFKFKKHVCQESYEDDDVFRAQRDDLEVDAPDYSDSARLAVRPSFLNRKKAALNVRNCGDARGVATEAVAWCKKYKAVVQQHQMRVNHHIHRRLPGDLDKDGARYPMPYCKSHTNALECSKEYPRMLYNFDGCARSGAAVCSGLVKRYGFKGSGRRCMLGAIVTGRKNEWLNGSHPVLLANLPFNSDVLVPYRLPLMPQTHSTRCELEGCLEIHSVSDIMKVLEQSMRDQIGYISDYVTKKQPVATSEVDRFIRGHRELQKQLHGSALSTAAIRHTQRLLSDVLGRGTARKAVECTNLIVCRRKHDVTAAESLKSHLLVPFPCGDYMRCQERICGAQAEAGAEYDGMEVDARNTAAKALVSKVKVPMQYGWRGGDPDVKHLSAHEFHSQWSVERVIYPTNCRSCKQGSIVTVTGTQAFENSEQFYHALLTPSGEHKLKAKAALDAGVDYVVRSDCGVTRNRRWLAFPHGSPYRDDWVMVRRPSPAIPRFDGRVMPIGGSVEDYSRHMLVYLRPWTLCEQHASEHCPLLSDVCAKGSTWEHAWRLYLDGNILSAHCQAIILNFQEVFSTRQVHDTDGDSKGPTDHCTLHLNDKDFEQAIQTKRREDKGGTSDGSFQFVESTWGNTIGAPGGVQRDSTAMPDDLGQAMKAARASQKKKGSAELCTTGIQKADVQVEGSQKDVKRTVSEWLARLTSESGDWLRCKNVQQQEVVTLIAERVLEEHADTVGNCIGSSDPINGLITGGPGVGKSFVVKAARELFDALGYSRGVGYAFTALQAVVASQLNGDTLHSLFGLNIYGQATSSQAKAEEIAATLSNMRWIIIDEVSQVTSELLGQCELQARSLVQDVGTYRLSPDGCIRTWAGINVLYVGDFLQLPPPGNGTCLSAIPDHVLLRLHPKKATITHGLNLMWENTPKLIELVEQVRCQDVWWNEVLEEFRVGQLSSDSHAFLHDQPTSVPGSWTKATGCNCGHSACAALVGANPRVIQRKECNCKRHGQPLEGCACCKCERKSRNRVTYQGDARLKQRKFKEAVTIVANNDLKYEICKARAAEFARNTGQRIVWSPAQDTAKADTLVTDPQLRKKKVEWLQYHNRKCNGLWGMLPLVIGLRLALVDHLDRSAKCLLRGRSGTLTGWVLDPREPELAATGDIRLQYPPKALIMQFDNCDWTLPGGYALPDCALTACIA